MHRVATSDPDLSDVRDDELRRLALPTLIVHGDHDLSAPVELTGQRIAELEKTPPDCSAETDRALEAERKLDDIRAVLSR